MIDSVGGPVKVNNLLTTLNLKPISGPNLKVIKRVLLCIIFFFSSDDPTGWCFLKGTMENP